jgi:hypothetical protein
VHEVPNSFVNLLNESEVNFTEPTLDAYDMDGDGEEVEDGDDEVDFKEIEEEVFNSLQSSRNKRVVNYESIDLEDELPGALFFKTLKISNFKLRFLK